MKKNDKIRILIADDHSVMRIGLTALLESTDKFKIVGEATDGEQAIEKAVELTPDVIVMDLMMPSKDGADATANILKVLPNAKVLVLTTFDHSDLISRALNAGASGALLKSASNDELIDAIGAVATGERRISPEILRILEEDPPARTMTSRQLAILQSITRGLTNQDIARQFGICEDSVKEHISVILSKLGAANRTEAVAIAMRKQLLKI